MTHQELKEMTRRRQERQMESRTRQLQEARDAYDRGDFRLAAVKFERIAAEYVVELKHRVKEVE